MTEDQHDEVREERPALAVLWGVLSLVAVAAIVGGVLAVGALVAGRVTGLSDGAESTADSTAQETLFLPSPTDSNEPDSYVTLSDVPEPDLPTSTFSEAPEEEITLESAQSEVGPMEPIDLTGTYPGGDGAVLLVQRFEAGTWGDFAAITVLVNGDQFSTFVQTGAAGENRFRVIDTETGEVSNEVAVTIV